MKLKPVLAASAGSLVLAAAAVAALPDNIHVERTALVRAAPEIIFPLLSSGAAFQRINPYLTADPALEITLNDVAEGVGSGFAFNGRDGQGTQVIASLEANRFVKMDIDLGPMGQPVARIDLEPTDGGTQVTWSMDMQVGWNPVGRVFGLFMDQMVGPTYEQGLVNIARVATST